MHANFYIKVPMLLHNTHFKNHSYMGGDYWQVTRGPRGDLTGSGRGSSGSFKMMSAQDASRTGGQRLGARGGQLGHCCSNRAN